MNARHNFVLLLTIVIGTVWGQSEPSVSDVLDQLPPELQGKVDASQVEQIANKSATVFKEKCEKNGGPDAYAKVEEVSKTLPTCVKDSLNLDDPTVIQKEIDVAKLNGTVDEVFKKYCAKSPAAKKCLEDALEKVKPCFTADERKNLKVIYNITEQLADFICFKDGDRIALFIAEGGPDCYQEKSQEIEKCLNSTFGDDFHLDTTNLTGNAIPQITFDDKQCDQLTQLQKCVVGALEQCKTPTSGNIIDSLFNFVRKATPCKPVETKPNSASGLALTSASVATALFAALFL